MDDPKQIREVTGALIREFVEWTHDASMFYSSPEGAAFGEELRRVFAIALKATDPLAAAERAVVEAAMLWFKAIHKRDCENNLFFSIARLLRLRAVESEVQKPEET